MNERMPKLSWEATLHSLLLPFPFLPFAGLVKNAGKTTALNAVNALFPDECIGLTSLGYDGEATDAIYHHPKPPIFVLPGQLVLTAERFLPDRTEDYDLLESWGSHPQYGRWLILRVTAPCSFRMAGPSTLSEIQKGLSRLKQHGATRLHIDGALNRLSHITLHKPDEDFLYRSALDNGFVLSTGAALGRTLDEVIDRTVHWIKLFQLPLYPSSQGPNGRDSAFNDQGVSPSVYPGIHPTINPLPIQNAFLRDNTWSVLPSFLWQHDLVALIPSQVDMIALNGAFTDSIYLALRAAQRLPRQFVVRSPAHILLSSAVLRGLMSRGIILQLLERPQIVMLTLSPWHPLTPLPTEHMAEALLPHSTIPLVDIEQHRVWLS